MKLRNLLTKTGLLSAALCGTALVAGPALAATLQSPLIIDNPVTGAELNSGSSADVFEVKPTGVGLCTGSSLNGYFITGYITDVDPTTLTFDADGPHSTTGLAYPLIDDSGTAYVDRNTGAPNPLVDPVKGQVLPTGRMGWTLYTDNSLVGPGTYHVGLACLDASRSIDQYFDTEIVITGSATSFQWQKPTTPPVPEVPYAVLLPGSAAAVLAAGGLFELRRRRQGTAAAV